MQRIALRLLACALFSLAGCELLQPPEGPRARAPELMLVYRDQVDSHTAVLRELAGAPPSAAPSISADRIRGALTLAERFRDDLSLYDRAVAEVEVDSPADELRAVQEALAKCERTREELGRRAAELAHAAGAAQTEYERLKLAWEEGGPAPDLQSARRFVAACLMLSRIAGEVDSHLADLHIDRLRSASETKRPIAAILHFLRLCALRREETAELSPRYKAAWRAWLAEELGKGRFESALRIFHFIGSASPAYRPSSLQEVREVADACLAQPPSLDVLSGVEARFAEIQALYAAEAAAREGVKRDLDMAKSSLLLARAQRTESPTERADLALQALKLNSFQVAAVAACLARAALDVGEAHLEAGRYAEGVRAVREMLARGPVADREGIVAQFREATIARMLGASRDAVRRARFDAAKAILVEAEGIAETSKERAEVREALRQYHASRVAHLFGRDVRQAISACREALQVFPNEVSFLDVIDRGLHQILREEIGDPATSWQRLGAEAILAKVRKTVREMRGRVGAGLCQQLIDGLAEAWWKRISETDDPSEAFRIAVEREKLIHPGTHFAKEEGARILQERLDRAVRGNQWAQAERCLDAYFSLCPDVQRPASFKGQYLRFLEHLDATGDARTLARHISIFVRAHPHDWRSVRRFVAKRSSADDPEGKIFLALLSSNEPNAPELRAFDTPNAYVYAEEELRGLVGAEESVSDDDRWWTAPPPPKAASTDPAPEARERTPAGRGSALVSVIGILVAGIGLLAYGAFLASATMRKGLLPFRWYAAAALGAGLAFGFMVARAWM